MAKSHYRKECCVIPRAPNEGDENNLLNLRKKLSIIVVSIETGNIVISIGNSANNIKIKTYYSNIEHINDSLRH